MGGPFKSEIPPTLEEILKFVPSPRLPLDYRLPPIPRTVIPKAYKGLITFKDRPP
jgi:hypothetical protein